MITDDIEISAQSPYSSDAITLMDELSLCLEKITGSTGKSSFDPEDVRSSRSVFVVAKNGKGEALGCGAIRPHSGNTAELKRLYAKPNSSGVGSKILAYLENAARGMGYTKICLETRKINENAVSFYLRKGYKIIPNFGRYAGNDKAVCFEKAL